MRHVDDQLADLHVALAAAEIVGVVLIGDLGDDVHVGEVVVEQAGRPRERLEPEAQAPLGEAQRREALGHVELLHAGEPRGAVGDAAE